MYPAMFSTLTKINKLFQVQQLTCWLVCIHVGYVHMTVPATCALRTMSPLRVNNKFVTEWPRGHLCSCYFNYQSCSSHDPQVSITVDENCTNIFSQDLPFFPVYRANVCDTSLISPCTHFALNSVSVDDCTSQDTYMYRMPHNARVHQGALALPSLGMTRPWLH